MKTYAAYYDRGWNVLEFDASKARRIETIDEWEVA